MNLAQVIHQRWAAAEPLNGLLPAERLSTGLSVDPRLPYAVLACPGTRPLARTNDGAGADAVAVRFLVYHDRCAAAADIAAQIAAAFDRSRFDLSGADKVLLMRRVGESRQQADDGTWLLTLDFECTVYLAAGA